MTAPQKPGTPAEDVSAIRVALKAKPRTGHEFDLAEILGLAEPQLARIRLARKGEVDNALAEAHRYAARKMSATPAAAGDDDILRDAKASSIIASVVREHKADGLMPVWPTGEVLMEEVEPDRIGALLALVNMVREREFPGFAPLDQDTIDFVIARSVANAGSDFPEKHLAIYSHAWLARLVVNLSLMIANYRNEAELAATPPEPEAQKEG